jgi:hypothetical protein
MQAPLSASCPSRGSSLRGASDRYKCAADVGGQIAAALLAVAAAMAVVDPASAEALSFSGGREIVIALLAEFAQAIAQSVPAKAQMNP